MFTVKTRLDALTNWNNKWQIIGYSEKFDSLERRTCDRTVVFTTGD